MSQLETRSRRFSPLGPGGRLLGGWRWLPTMLALGVVAANTLVLFSDRAPGMLSRLSDRLEVRASQANRLRQQLRLGASDLEVHVLLWAVATVLVGLAAWSWGSLLLGGVGLFLYSLVVEGLQPVLTTTRELQGRDALANATGVILGLVVVGLAALAWRAVRR